MRRRVKRLTCPACGSANTRVTGGRAGVKWIGETAWRLHYCLNCDHKFPSVQRRPGEDDYISGDDGLAHAG